jgi:antitoxin (DNA-binding transcriptional repressor) of toxin-antitoxin stability system
MSHYVSSSDLKRQLGAWLDWVARTRETLVIETYGRPVAVLLAHDEYADYLAFRQARDQPPRHHGPPAEVGRMGGAGLAHVAAATTTYRAR